MNILYRLVRFFIVFLMNLPLYYLLMKLIILPLRFVSPRLYWKFEGCIFDSQSSVVSFWMSTGGFKIFEMGDDPSNFVNDECIVVANHQNTADVPVFLSWLNFRNNVAANVMWIIDVMFRWSHFGIISAGHRDYFIEQGRHIRDTSLMNLKKHLMNWFVPLKRKWIMVFPEGGFLYKRLESSQAYALKHNYPVLNHVTLPRIGAVKAILDTLEKTPNKVKYIMDVTMAYDEVEGVNVGNILFGSFKRPFSTWLYTRTYPADQIPREENELLLWLYDRWNEKERRIQYFKDHGIFPILETDKEDLTGPREHLIRTPRPVCFSNSSLFHTCLVHGISTLFILYYSCFGIRNVIAHVCLYFNYFIYK